MNIITFSDYMFKLYRLETPWRMGLVQSDDAEIAHGYHRDYQSYLFYGYWAPRI